MSYQPLIKAILAATGASLAYVVSNAANYGQYALEVTVLGTIGGYFVADILEAEYGSSTTS